MNVKRLIVILLMLCLGTTASAASARSYENLHTALRNQGQLISTVQEANRSDQDQMLCLAMNIYQEVRGAPSRDQWAVAFVTWNRTQRTIFKSKTICAAVWAPGQFSWTSRSTASLLPRERAVWTECQHKASLIVRGEKMNDPTNGSTHFYQARLNPGWAHRLLSKIRIGGHIFARLPGSN